jgi:hypothetical protein
MANGPEESSSSVAQGAASGGALAAAVSGAIDALKGKEKKGSKEANISPMGWDLEDLADDIAVPRVKIMSRADAIATMGRIADAAVSDRVHSNCTLKESDANRAKFEQAVVLYGIMNSGSHQHDFAGQKIQGPFGMFDARHIQLECGDELRRFYRAYANEAHAMLCKRTKLAIALCNRVHLDTKWKFYAFDFADGCDDIPEDCLAALEGVKFRRANRSSQRPKVPKGEKEKSDPIPEVEAVRSKIW